MNLKDCLSIPLSKTPDRELAERCVAAGLFKDISEAWVELTPEQEEERRKIQETIQQERKDNVRRAPGVKTGWRSKI